MSQFIYHMVSGAPEPVAPFSHAVEADDGWVYITGQMPLTSLANDSPYPEGIEAQTHQVMKNLMNVLEGCGLTLDNVAVVKVYLLHFDEDYKKMNEVYASYWPIDKRPARTCIGVSGLCRSARVEIDMIAKRPTVISTISNGIAGIFCNFL
jgi:2-iminobutanoate/2-iminopropanoate deaminase